ATWLAAGELRQLGAPRLTAAFPWLAAALLATTRWHIHFSRMGIEPILAPLVTATALWLLRAKRTTAAANSKYSGRHRLHAQRHQRHQQPHDNQIQHIERNLHPHAQRFRHR
ncbi:MAG TPA: cytochrome d ubiquinol oxidase subunit II, partial [Chloroflexi bacterium]|nr:cytochrome d ubiquinol oxidase subunit II [Chloroflexota bacterium]